MWVLQLKIISAHFAHSWSWSCLDRCGWWLNDSIWFRSILVFKILGWIWVSVEHHLSSLSYFLRANCPDGCGWWLKMISLVPVHLSFEYWIDVDDAWRSSLAPVYSSLEDIWVDVDNWLIDPIWFRFILSLEYCLDRCGWRLGSLFGSGSS